MVAAPAAAPLGGTRVPTAKGYTGAFMRQRNFREAMTSFFLVNSNRKLHFGQRCPLYSQFAAFLNCEGSKSWVIGRPGMSSSIRLALGADDEGPLSRAGHSPGNERCGRMHRLW